jgi:CheY-like chemotaxis protein
MPACVARILIVDDERAIRTTIDLLLKRAGYQVAAAADGREGLKKIEVERFDLLIVDIFMPGMDGLETIQKVHQLKPSLPIVVMSGMVFRSASSPPPDFLTMATKLGAVKSLRKPFRPHELLAVVADSLNISSNAAATTIPQQVALRNVKDDA